MEKMKDYAVSQFSRGKAMGYAFRDEQYRYVFWITNSGKIGPKSTPAFTFDKLKAQELYDYKADPLETKNIAKDPTQSERIKAFRQKAKDYLKAQAERIAKQPQPTLK
jgi:arylsulfatase A-like enzyme